MGGSVRNNNSAKGSNATINTASVTVGAWIRAGATSYTTGPRYQYLVEVGIPARVYAYQIFTDTNDDLLKFYSDETGEVAILSGSSVSWIYVRLTTNGTSVTLEYRTIASTTWNLVTSFAVSSTNVTWYSFFDTWYADGLCVDGYLRSAGVWEAVLTQAESLTESGSTAAVRTSNLRGYYAGGAVPSDSTWGTSVPSGTNLTQSGTAAPSADDPIPDGFRIMPIVTLRVREFETPPSTTTGLAPLVAPAGTGLVLGANKPGVPMPVLMQRVADGDAVFDVGLGEGKAGGYKFGLGAVTPNAVNGPPVTDTGTPVAATYAPGNVGQKHWRVRYPTTAGAGTLGGWRANAAFLSAGNSIGFLYRARFVLNEAAAVSGARAFVGLSDSVAAPTNVDPAALTNAIGVARLSADNTQLYLISAGSSAQTATALGTGFPPFTGTANGSNGVPYELTIYAKPNNDLYWALRRLDTLALTSGQITTTAGTQRPAADLPLAPRGWCTNNATAAATALEMIDSSWLRLGT